ncbi:T-cell surface antigen CD2-like [Anguilla anguilla]|uniref:T-cell surface antigen CD2-like n=1 Tax=Anguilla anguilla TaxID=7936 RepID=UPI0015ACCDA1|nr:T-cell surface antigen CD2-like [Anguilla anguilla]
MSCTHCILIPFTIALASLTLGEKKNCDYYPLGGSVNFKLEYQGLSKDENLIWRKDEEIIFERKRGNIKPGKETDITPGGDLKLNNLQASHDGKYQGQVFDNQGKSHKNSAKKICVIERVTKPTVQLDCKTTTLTCKVERNPTDLTFSWQGDKNKLPHDSSKIQFKSGQPRKYSCSVKNPVSNATSDEIEINCEDKKSADKVTFLGTGFDFWLEILILAGGGILLVILVVVVVVCVCRRRRHRLQLLRDEEEFRLTNLTHSQQPHSHGHHSHQAPPQKTQAPPQMTHAGQYGHPHSDAHPPALPKPRGQSRPRPAHPPGPAHGQEDLPPRPKPRKGPRPPRS